MASETTTEMLRAAIETALRRRDPRATVQRSPTESDRSLWIARWPRLEIMTRGDDGHFGLDALRALAVACGLRVDLCPACNGRGRRAYGREVEDGCDECECSGVVVVDPAEEVERLTMALDRAHHAVREHGPRCSHPECDALAPLRCDDCGRRFCDEHDDGLAGHDPGFGPQAHAVGPDDLMAGAAMRAAGRSIGEPRDMTDAEMEEVLSSDETTLDAQIRAEGRDPAAVEKSVRDGLLGDVAQAKRDALRKIIEGPRG